MNAFEDVLEKVEKACDLAQRKKEEIKLIAVSKNHSAEAVLKAYQQGCRDFGENRVQEFIEKKKELPNDINWHIIGSLQRNKVNKTLGQTTLIHSIDTFKLAQDFSEKSLKQNITTNVLLQVNTSLEASKHGFSPDQCLETFEELLNLNGINIQGLMTMAPLSDNEKIVRQSFAALRQLKEQLKDQFSIELPHLSMGMSQDYHLAIQEGATMIRIGRAIFGPRT